MRSMTAYLILTETDIAHWWSSRQRSLMFYDSHWLALRRSWTVILHFFAMVSHAAQYNVQNVAIVTLANSQHSCSRHVL